MMLRKTLLLGAALPAMLALAPAGLHAQGAPGGGGGAPPTAITTDRVVVGDVPINVASNGVVQSESVVTIRPRVDGQITQVHVQEGQFVRRGQPLFTLDARLNQALLAQQEAQLMRDRASATRAQADAVRYQSLRGESFASQQRFEQAQADAAAAAATVLATQALIQQTRLSIEFAQIVAEADGQLGALPLRVGNFVRQAENVALGSITQINPILVQFSIPERWLPMIRATQAAGGNPAVLVRMEGDAGPPSRGEIVFVDSQVDTTTGTIALKGRFENSNARLWPGQYVQVSVAAGVSRNAITVPSAAVQTGQQGRFVFVAEQGVARRRAVELVRVNGDRAVVTGELRDGESVIVDGAQRVVDGGRVVERGQQGQRVSQVTER
ncbi:efflux RND transporter periplasmic adaptor subunit [Rhodovarius lipocyclicus]|uniref:efflux RND transporter periplasmic adaptor subunit n=1 Tax=Rhodovarius lipocyclicus TaxID=268410 RepID=UPI001F48B03F|nr:efflux RND transporter periplasmic adaptor subunit [Rhodovarius lipocyclicus]